VDPEEDAGYIGKAIREGVIEGRIAHYAIGHLEAFTYYDPVNLRSSNSKAKCELMINIDNIVPPLDGERSFFSAA
jgi:hypothetical protein